MTTTADSTRRIAILAHEKFPDRAKTALGVIRYGGDEIVAVLDRDNAGSSVTDHVSDVQDAPIVDSFAAIDNDVDALLIGIAPIGGGFDESWRDDVETAIRAGCDIIAGLHYFLNEDEELVSLAEEHGVELVDVRKPKDDLTVSQGIADQVDAHVALTVGTDCSVGKMTVALGNDGPPCNNTLDPFTEMRQASLLQKVETLDPTTTPAGTILQMATTNGAQAAGFDQVGALREGWKADIIGLRTDITRATPLHDVLSHLVFSAHGDDVVFTMVDGEVLYEDSEHIRVDADRIRSQAHVIADGFSF